MWTRRTNIRERDPEAIGSSQLLYAWPDVTRRREHTGSVSIESDEFVTVPSWNNTDPVDPSAVNIDGAGERLDKEAIPNLFALKISATYCA